MDDQGKDGLEADSEQHPSDIQDYLASFNKEIEEEDDPSSNHNENSKHSSEEQQEEYTTTTYYAASDGSLYRSPNQPSGNQQQVFHTLSTGQGIQAIANGGGLQQIILVGNSGGITFGDGKENAISVPLAQILQGSQIKNVLPSGSKIKQEKGVSPTFIAMNPGTSLEEQRKDSDALNMVQSDSAEGSQPHTIMLVQQSDMACVEDGMENSQTIVAGLGKELQIDEERTLQMMANLAEHAAAKASGGSTNSVIVNTGDSYQTVTIVPSDTNPGEVSYVLYLSQAEDVDKGDENGDMSVYEFQDGEKPDGIVQEDMRTDIKVRALRIAPRKSQMSTANHMCNYCNYTSPKRYLLSRHMKSHSDERPHKCTVCERGFKTLASLQNHVNTHTGTRPHMCKSCDSCFTTSGELVRHVRYKHTHEKPHRCTECDYASVELSKLKRHMRCHTGERPYQCPHCTYASPDTYKLKRHLRIHTGEKPYECDICQARFTQSNSLKAHKLIHSGNKPVFQCQFCPTTCGRKTDLRIHVQKLHSCDRTHKCKRCGKVFVDRYTYKVHAKTHDGEKCFKCDLCPYASISQRHLETHMFIHTDQKPFQCDECDQSFRQKQLLKRHKNLYHDPYYVPPVPKEKTNECVDCGKAFRHKGNLIRHLAVHDPRATIEEKEQAMRIGQPKGPGEDEDGEEDDYLFDDERKDGQQVVVFEVIQVPQHNGNSSMDGQLFMTGGQPVTLSGSEYQDCTIIQPVPDDGINIVESLLGSPDDTHQEISNKQSALDSSVEPMPSPRRRGRPRKYPILTEVHAAAEKIDEDENIQEETLDKKTRHIRKRKLFDGDIIDEAEILHTPARRGRPPKNSTQSTPKPKIIQLVPDNVQVPAIPKEFVVTPDIIIQDPEIIIKREQELERKRLEQKQKDMDECFGFNDNEDEEVILSMSAAPGYHVVTEHVGEEPNS